MQISLRPATQEDFDFLWWLHRATMRPYVEKTWGWDEQWQARCFRDHFDPNTREIIEGDGESILQREDFVNVNGHRGTLLRVPDPQDFPAGLSSGIETLVNGILRVWADQETADLLQYVYHTKPMRQARRGDKLDFSIVPSGTHYYELYIPVQKPTVRRLRESLRSYALDDVDEFVRPTTVYDEVLDKGLRALDDDETSIPDFTGVTPPIPTLCGAQSRIGLALSSTCHGMPHSISVRAYFTLTE